jgi:hypothetical protein
VQSPNCQLQLCGGTGLRGDTVATEPITESPFTNISQKALHDSELKRRTERLLRDRKETMGLANKKAQRLTNSSEQRINTELPSVQTGQNNQREDPKYAEYVDGVTRCIRLNYDENCSSTRGDMICRWALRHWYVREVNVSNVRRHIEIVRIPDEILKICRLYTQQCRAEVTSPSHFADTLKYSRKESNTRFGKKSNFKHVPHNASLLQLNTSN